jgi:hypothetical protein
MSAFYTVKLWPNKMNIVKLSNASKVQQWNELSDSKQRKTFLNFTTTSLKHFHPPTRNPTDAPKIQLKIQAINLEANL